MIDLVSVMLRAQIQQVSTMATIALAYHTAKLEAERRQWEWEQQQRTMKLYSQLWASKRSQA